MRLSLISNNIGQSDVKMRLFLISKQIKASGMCNQVNIVKRRVCGIVERDIETHMAVNEKREKN